MIVEVGWNGGDEDKLILKEIFPGGVPLMTKDIRNWNYHVVIELIY
jgi:hypothetical protein